MNQYLELIAKKKLYIEKLKQNIKETSKDLECLRKQEDFTSRENGNLYIKLNSLNQTEKEHSIVVGITISSLLLFVLSVFAFSVLFSFELPFYVILSRIVAFNVGQVLLMTFASKLVKAYFERKREEQEEDIKKIFLEIDENHKTMLDLNSNIQLLLKRKNYYLQSIALEEREIQQISEEILNIILKNPSLSMQVNAFLEKELDESKQIELDNNMKRVLSHLENK